MCAGKNDNLNPSIPWYETLEIPVNSVTVDKFLFPVDQNLQDAKKITSIQSFRVANVSTSPETGSALVSATVFSNAFLVLVKGKDEKIQYVPLSMLDPTLNSGYMRVFELPDGIDVTKCYIQLGDTTGLVSGTVFLLGFVYEK